MKGFRAGSRFAVVGAVVLATTLMTGTPAVRAAPFLTSPGSKISGILTGVSCPTQLVCMASGNSALVIRTTDGGGRWTVLTSPPKAEGLVAVSCPTKLRCEVVGSGNGDAGAVYGTHDGGRSWRAQPAVIEGGFFLSVSCATVEICEATGNSGAIYGTTDGGKDWALQQVPSNADLVEGVSCPTTQTCEAVGYGGSGMALRTVDGGATWRSQQLPKAVQFLQGVDCPTADFCVADGQNVIHAGSKEIGVIVTTTNGGRSWERRVVPAGFGDLTSAACPTVHICEAVGLGPAILGSTDGGVTWKLQPVPGAPYLLGVSCSTSRSCEAVGQTANGDVAVYGTTDGHTWTRQPIGSS